MSLLNKLKEDSLTARKERNLAKGLLLSTVYSDASMIGKNKGNRESTDEEVMQVINKFVKGLKETKGYLNDRGLSSESVDIEIAILNGYLPTMLSEDALETLIAKYISEGKNSVGSVMAELKAYHSGLYDGKVASGIIRRLLA